MRTLDRYLVREVVRPLTLVFLLLTVIFAGYSAAEFLARAAGGDVRADTVVLLILLKVVIGMEVLLPVALYLTVVFGLGRLIANREVTAMAVCGLGRGGILKALAGVFLAVAILVGVLSVWVRPLAYRVSYALRARVEATFDVSDVREGRFYGSPEGGRTIYADDIDSESGHLRRVMIWLDKGPVTMVIRAMEAVRAEDPESGSPVLELHDVYTWYPGKGSGPTLARAESITIRLDDEDVAPLEYKRKAASTQHLLGSDASRDVAELQWRLTRPLSAFLLGLLAVLVSRGRPRRDRFGRTAGAVLAFAAYYQLQIMAKNQVEDGVVGAVPGLWWVEALMLGVILSCLLVPVLLRPRARLNEGGART